MAQTFSLSSDLVTKLHECRKLSEQAKSQIEPFVKSNLNTKQKKALMILVFRAIKYFDCYCNCVETGYGEPGTMLIRSIFEMDLLVHWIVKDAKNAEIYFQSAMRKVAHLVELVQQRPELSEYRKMLPPTIPERFSFKKLPGMEEIARNVGLMNEYDFFYRPMSSYAHTDAYSLSEELIHGKMSYDPSPNIIEPVIPMAMRYFKDLILTAINGMK